MTAVTHRTHVPAVLMWTFAAACGRHGPPAPLGSASVARPELEAAAPAPDTVSRSAGAAPSATPAPASSAPDPAFLPQTHDRPRASGATFDSRIAALADAIANDDPDRGMSFFFPLGAYQQVKDVANPAADWKRRLVAAYARDIHALHARLAAATRASSAARAIQEGDAGGSVQFLGIDVPDARGRWVEPGEEYNKIGYFRVFGSKMRWEVAGLTQTFDVKSLISWRGEWYVVHLSAIQ